jgi:rare lipoprotein A
MKCWPLLLPAIFVLSACGTLSRSGGYYQDDGPDARPPADVLAIPDAVPKSEPKSAKGNNSYSVEGKTFYPLTDASGYHERGVASWYGKKFHGKRTSSGEPYDMYAMTAAHKTLPLPCYVRVRNLENGRAIVARVNDRGPFLHNRLIDLSYAGAARLGILGTGTGMVEVEVISPDESDVQVATTKESTVEIFPYAAGREPAKPPASATAPRLYLQAGAFGQMDNAVNLRNRLEHEATQPVFIQSALVSNATAQEPARIYRVRIGPLASVEEGDRLTQKLAQAGVPDALIVVE